MKTREKAKQQICVLPTWNRQKMVVMASPEGWFMPGWLPSKHAAAFFCQPYDIPNTTLHELSLSSSYERIYCENQSRHSTLKGGVVRFDACRDNLSFAWGVAICLLGRRIEVNKVRFSLLRNPKVTWKALIIMYKENNNVWRKKKVN